MGHRFADLLFSEPVQAVQRAEGSHEMYARLRTREDYNFVLTAKEAGFIAARDSFYMATVSPDGWPYIQHRGGAKGFVKILDERHLGFADFRGNRQYISTGNLRANDRAALFFMDYENKRRLKLIGHVREINDEQDLQLLSDPEYNARVERGFIIQVEGFDWNCSQHITERFTLETLHAY